MTHTAGPWHIGPFDRDNQIFSDNGRMRLETGGTTLYPIATVNDGWDNTEDEANARLIAAAPELLAALKECVPWLESMPLATGDQPLRNKAARDLYNAQAAIAKAEGKDPQVASTEPIYKEDFDTIEREEREMTKEITKEDCEEILAAIERGTPTPGPWEPMMDGPKRDRKPWEPWEASMEAAPGLTIGCRNNTEPICRVSGYLQPVKANARLIASAPDLLAALKTVEWRGSQEFGDVCPCCRGMSVGGHKTDCQLAAALQKAKGESL